MEVLMTRSDAMARGEKRYFTGKPCIHGHVEERQVSNKTCMACSDDQHRKKSPATKAKDEARKRAWHESRRTEQLEKKRHYYQENMDRMKALGAAYRAERKEEQAVRRRAHYEANKDRYVAQVRARTLAQQSALPAWANRDAIAAFYREARALGRATGVKHNVDHIVPLRGRLVCGLHVENNLRVIPQKENFAKHNSWVAA